MANVFVFVYNRICYRSAISALRRQLEQTEAVVKQSNSECTRLQQELRAQKLEADGERKLLQVQLKTAQENALQSAAALKSEQLRGAQLNGQLHALEMEKVSLSQQMKSLTSSL